MINNTNLLSNDLNSLITENINLVHYFAKRINIAETGFYDYDDIFQIGTIGLIKAAKTYNGMVKFSSYASRCINNEIYMFLKNKRNCKLMKSLNEPIYVDDDIELQDVIQDDISVDEQIESLRQIELVYNIVLNNFPYDKSMCILYMADSRKQNFISKEFNISQSSVSKFLSSSILDIKRYMNYNIIKRKIFNVNVGIDKTTISFFTSDSIKAKKLIAKLKEQFSYIESFEIKYINNKMSISITYVEYLLDVVLYIIKNIDYYSISLIEANKDI